MTKFKMMPVAWAALAVAAGAHAQGQGVEGGEPTKELATVTVIGTLDALQSLDFYAPSSSAVLQRKDIEAQGARKLDQALQYQAGVVSEPYGSDNKVEWFKIRGFDASTSLDGAPTTPNGFFVWKPELYGVESVEVLKGANSLVFGAANTGGVVNLVTKRPHKQQALQVDAELGTRGKRGLGLDYNGLANADGSAYTGAAASTLSIQLDGGLYGARDSNLGFSATISLGRPGFLAALAAHDYNTAAVLTFDTVGTPWLTAGDPLPPSLSIAVPASLRSFEWSVTAFATFNFRQNDAGSIYAQYRDIFVAH